MRTWNGTVETFEIYAKDIQAAKKAMTVSWLWFKSRVLDCIADEERAIITIETCGKLNIFRNRWKKFIILPEQQRGNGVAALQYRMDKVEQNKVKKNNV